ncbi:MAG: hypothetical protein WD016_04060 [Balneolaceae bacterium]
MSFMTFLSYVTIGLFIGLLSYLIVKHKGITLLPSLSFGVIGALTGAAIVYAIGGSGAGFYATIGAISVLFTVNVFRKEKTIFGDDDDQEESDN